MMKTPIRFLPQNDFVSNRLLQHAHELSIEQCRVLFAFIGLSCLSYQRKSHEKSRLVRRQLHFTVRDIDSALNPTDVDLAEFERTIMEFHDCKLDVAGPMIDLHDKEFHGIVT